MNDRTVDICHRRRISIEEIESLFVPIFGDAYRYLSLLDASNHQWCAYLDQQLIGCVLAKESSEDSILYLILIGIENLYRSKGIGTRLLTAIADQAESFSYKTIFLHTECTNERAIKFYGKLHFHIDSIVYNYYRTMHNFYPHAFQMSRTLEFQRRNRILYGRY